MFATYSLKQGSNRFVIQVPDTDDGHRMAIEWGVLLMRHLGAGHPAMGTITLSRDS